MEWLKTLKTKNKTAVVVLLVILCVFIAAIAVCSPFGDVMVANADTTHIVTFVMNGGLYNNSSMSLEYLVTDGACVNRPTDPVYATDYYAFNGWYTGAANGDGTYTLYHQYDFRTPITEDITLYAAWLPTAFTVTFKNGGITEATFYNVPSGATLLTQMNGSNPEGFYLYLNGTPLYDTRETYTGGLGNGLVPIPHKEGMTFVMWESDTKTEDNPGLSVFSDTIFYATFARGDVYIVTTSFELEDGSIVAMSNTAIYAYLNDDQFFNMDIKVPNVVGYSVNGLSYYKELTSAQNISLAGLRVANGAVKGTVDDAVIQTLCELGHIESEYNEEKDLYVPTVDSAGYAHIELIILFDPGSGTPYRVNYFRQNSYDDDYVLHDYVERTAKTGNRLDLTKIQQADGTTLSLIPVYEGFQITSSSAGSTVVLIKPDGSTVVNIYYDRIAYYIYFDTQGGTYYDAIQLKLEQTIPTFPLPTKSGCIFDEWTFRKLDGTVLTDEIIPGTAPMPAYDVYATAQWVHSDTTYTIAFFAENEDNSAFQTVGTLTLNSQTADVINIADLSNTILLGFQDAMGSEAAYFNYNQNLSVDFNGSETITVRGDGSTHLNAYFNRNYYTLRFQLGDGSKFYNSGGTSVSGGSNITLTRDGTVYNNTTSESGMYSITAKYNADISAYWPKMTDISPSRISSGSNYYPYGWAYETSNSVNVTGVFTMNSELIRTSSTSETISLGYGTVSATVNELKTSVSDPSSNNGTAMANVNINGKTYSGSATLAIGNSLNNINATITISAQINGISIEVPVNITYDRIRSGYFFSRKYSFKITASSIGSVTIDGKNATKDGDNYIVSTQIKDTLYTYTSSGTTMKLYWINSTTNSEAHYYFEQIPNVDYSDYNTATRSGKLYYEDTNFYITGAFSSLSAKEITGFQSGVVTSSGNIFTLYYDRDRYNVSYYNGNSIAYKREVMYGESLATYASPEAGDSNFKYYAITSGKKSWTFAGWHIDSACTTPVDFANSLMGDTDITVYAKWVAPNYTVTYNLQGGSFIEGVELNDYLLYGDGTYRRDFAEGSVIDNNFDATVVERNGYEFLYWYFLNGDNEVRYQFLNSQYIYGDVSLYAKWDADDESTYSIYYLVSPDNFENNYNYLTDGNGDYILYTLGDVSYYQLAAPEMRTKQIYGSCISIQARHFTRYLPDFTVKEITLLGADGELHDNVYFYYTAFYTVTYYIHYVEWKNEDYSTLVPPETAKFLANTETVVLQNGDLTSENFSITIRGKIISGYTYRSAAQKTFVLSADESYNHFYFYYLPNAAEVYFTANYYIMDANGEYPVTGSPTYSCVSEEAIGKYLYATDLASSYASFLAEADTEALSTLLLGHTIDNTISDVFIIINRPAEGVSSAEINVINVYMKNGTYVLTYNLNDDEFGYAIWNDQAREEHETSSSIPYYIVSPNSIYTESIMYPGAPHMPIAPSRNGYDFIGWSTNVNSTANEFDFSENLSEDTVIYAIWKSWPIVTYYLIGGTWVDDTGTFSACDPNNVPLAYADGYYTFVNNGQCAPIPVQPYKSNTNDGLVESFALTGWSTTDPAEAVNLFDFGNRITSDVYLFAVWERTDGMIYIKNVDADNATKILSGGEFSIDRVFVDANGDYVDSNGVRYITDSTFIPKTVSASSTYQGDPTAFYDTESGCIVFSYLTAGSYIITQTAAHQAINASDRSYLALTNYFFVNATITDGVVSLSIINVSNADADYVLITGHEITVRNESVLSNLITVIYQAYKNNALVSSVSEDVGYFIYGNPYTITLNTASYIGYNVTSHDSLSGTMGEVPLTINVRLDAELYSLTIRYLKRDGTEISSEYSERIYYYGDAYAVNSPIIEGYENDNSSVQGTMGTYNLFYTVYYTNVVVKATLDRAFNENDYSIMSTVNIVPKGYFSLLVDEVYNYVSSDSVTFSTFVPQGTMLTLVYVPYVGATRGTPSYYYYRTTEASGGVTIGSFMEMGSTTRITLDSTVRAKIMVTVDFTLATEDSQNTVATVHVGQYRYNQTVIVSSIGATLEDTVLVGENAEADFEIDELIASQNDLVVLGFALDENEEVVFLSASLVLTINGHRADFYANYFYLPLTGASIATDGMMSVSLSTDKIALLPDNYILEIRVFTDELNLLGDYHLNITILEPAAVKTDFAESVDSAMISAGENIELTFVSLSNGTNTAMNFTLTRYDADGVTEYGSDFSSLITVSPIGNNITISVNTSAPEGVYRFYVVLSTIDPSGNMHTARDYVEFVVKES